MTTGDHKHCFCRENTAGEIVCCKCGQPLGAQVVDREIFLLWEQMGHLKAEIENEEKMKQGIYNKAHGDLQPLGTCRQRKDIK